MMGARNPHSPEAIIYYRRAAAATTDDTNNNRRRHHRRCVDAWRLGLDATQGGVFFAGHVPVFMLQLGTQTQVQNTYMMMIIALNKHPVTQKRCRPHGSAFMDHILRLKYT